MKWPKEIAVADSIQSTANDFNQDGVTPISLLGWFSSAFGYNKDRLKEFIHLPIDQEAFLLCHMIRVSRMSTLHVFPNEKRLATIYNLTFYLLGYTDGNEVDATSLSLAQSKVCPSVFDEVFEC